MVGSFRKCVASVLWTLALAFVADRLLLGDGLARAVRSLTSTCAASVRGWVEAKRLEAAGRSVDQANRQLADLAARRSALAEQALRLQQRRATVIRDLGAGERSLNLRLKELGREDEAQLLSAAVAGGEEVAGLVAQVRVRAAELDQLDRSLTNVAEVTAALDKDAAQLRESVDRRAGAVEMDRAQLAASQATEHANRLLEQEGQAPLTWTAGLSPLPSKPSPRLARAE